MELNFNIIYQIPKIETFIDHFNPLQSDQMLHSQISGKNTFIKF